MSVILTMRVKGGRLLHLVPADGLMALCGYAPRARPNGGSPWRLAVAGHACPHCQTHKAASAAATTPKENR